MKLTGKYLSFQEYRLAENPIYERYKYIFYKVYDPVPDFKLENLKIEQGKYTYIESDSEKNFYSEKYLHLSSQANLLQISKEHNIDLNIAQTNENILMDFIFKIDYKLLVLNGRKGWGKSTLLRYVLCHLIPKQQKDGKLPIYISFNEHINELNNASNERTIDNIFYDKILLNIIRKYTNDILVEMSQAFCDYLIEQPEFSKFKLQRERILHSEAYKNKDFERERKLEEIEDKILHQKETVLYSLKYLSKIHSVTPLIVFDDIDPLNCNMLEWLYNEAYKLSTHYGFKTLIALRPNSFQEICNKRTNDGALIPKVINMNAPNCNLYLEETLQRLDLLIRTDKSIQNSNIQLDKIKISPEDISEFFKDYSSVLLTKESKEFLANISNGDLRKYQNMLHTYFSSGFIKTEKIMGKIVEKNNDDYFPSWIIYSSIITNNYLTVFHQVKLENNDFIINILCNGGTFYNSYLIRMHLLSFLCRKHVECNIKDVLSQYGKMTKMANDESLKDSIARVFARFNNAGLIYNNLHHIIHTAEEVYNAKLYNVDALAYYYQNTLLTNFEYLLYMKDDIDYIENSHNIRNCIDVLNFSERFKEVSKYINFLYDEELNFLAALTQKQRGIYLENFSPNKDTLFFSLIIIKKMIEYGRNKRFSVDNLELLKKKIELSTIEFLKKRSRR